MLEGQFHTLIQSTLRTLLMKHKAPMRVDVPAGAIVVQLLRVTNHFQIESEAFYIEGIHAWHCNITMQTCIQFHFKNPHRFS